MRYEVAIPSYKRPRRISETTLPLLTERGVPSDRITVWVSDDEEFAEYTEALAEDGYGNIRVRSHKGGAGVRQARNGIARAYKPGTRLLQIDDDVQDVMALIPPEPGERPKHLRPVRDLNALIVEGFELADQARVSLWCLYPVKNPYFMSERTRVGFFYAEACWIGLTVRGDDAELVSVDDKEDFERSIKHFLRDGGVLRIDNVTFKSNFYKEPGGMQSYRTMQTITDGAAQLASEYPQLCSLHVSKGRGMPEVRFKRFPTLDLPAAVAR